VPLKVAEVEPEPASAGRRERHVPYVPASTPALVSTLLAA